VRNWASGSERGIQQLIMVAGSIGEMTGILHHHVRFVAPAGACFGDAGKEMVNARINHGDVVGAASGTADGTNAHEHRRRLLVVAGQNGQPRCARRARPAGSLSATCQSGGCAARGEWATSKAALLFVDVREVGDGPGKRAPHPQQSPAFLPELQRHRSSPSPR
jgi:hypothetical protein